MFVVSSLVIAGGDIFNTVAPQPLSAPVSVFVIWVLASANYLLAFGLRFRSGFDMTSDF